MTHSNLEGGPWPPSLREGTRIEVAPFRNGRPYGDYGAFDGSVGTILGPTSNGRRLWVELEGEKDYRSGKMGLPPEILMPLEGTA